jgi:AraC-like DNA-binding protein
MLLRRFNVASTSNIEEMVEGIRARSKQFTAVDAKSLPGWNYVHNVVTIGSVRIGVSKATHVLYRQEELNDVVVTGSFSGTESMNNGVGNRDVSHLASFSPVAVRSGMVADASFWTVRVSSEKFALYLSELELKTDPRGFIDRHWLTPLPGSAKFTVFIQYILNYVDEIDPQLSIENRAIEDLIYVNTARLMAVEDARPKSVGNAKTFSRCVEYIDHHISEEITIWDLAQLSGLSIRSLQYLFKNSTGMSITAFLAERRLQRARELLNGEHVLPTVQAVCSAVGIHNLSYFSRLYRKRFGQPPSVALRRNR